MHASWRAASPATATRCRRGFSTAELLLALLVFALGGALALTLAGRIRQRLQCDRFIAELRAHATALEGHQRRHGAWPATAAEVADLRSAPAWTQGSPFGGEYGWTAPAPGRPGRITLTAFAPNLPLTLSPADLRYIDARLDDGNLAGGRFRTGFNGWPVYLVGDSN